MLTCAAALALPWSFWTAQKRTRVARAIDDTPTSQVRSAAQGYVELVGTAGVAPGGAILAPLTRRRCVWWRFSIEKRQRENENDRWSTEQSGVSDETFLIADPSGSCVVDPDGAEVYPSDKRVWYGSTDWPSEVLGTRSAVVGLFHTHRYTEYVIGENVRVNAIGEFRTLGTARGDHLDEDIAALLRQWKRDQPSLLRRFDANHDGVLSAVEWEQARLAARSQILDEYASVPLAGAVNMLARPKDERPFLIAAEDLGRVARNVRWQVRGCWVLFVGAAGLLTWLLIHI